MIAADYGLFGWRRFVGNGAFYRQTMALLIPMFIQNTVTNVVSLLDNLMVGAIGTLPMAAVAIVNQIYFIFIISAWGGLSGPGIFATQYYGAKDEVGLCHCFRAKLYVILAIAVISMLIFLLFPTQLIQFFLSGDMICEEYEKTVKYALEYLFIMTIGVVPFGVSMLYATTLRECGETRVPMIASVTAILVNLLFNYLLIFGKFGFPRMEVLGAAIATTLARFVEMAIILIYTHNHISKYPFMRKVYKGFKVPKELVCGISKRGLPLFINEILWSCGMTYLFHCYSARGIHVVAAINIANTASQLFSCAFISMGSAVAIMVGHVLGANKLDEAKSVTWKLIAFSVFISLIMVVLLLIAAPIIPTWFNVEEDIRKLATKLLIVISTTMPFLSFNHASYFAIRAGGRCMLNFVFDGGFAWAIVAPITWYIGFHTDIDIVYFYFLSRGTEILKTIIAFALVKSGIWVRNIVSQ